MKRNSSLTWIQITGLAAGRVQTKISVNVSHLDLKHLIKNLLEDEGSTRWKKNSFKEKKNSKNNRFLNKSNI